MMKLCCSTTRSRSREGAWIEITICEQAHNVVSSRSREGAWIEIYNDNLALVKQNVAPVRERGLKLCLLKADSLNNEVAPVRERGLKLKHSVYINAVQ